MASLSLLRYLIECDGCKAVFGAPKGFDSLTEARAAAYATGWRFPHMLNRAKRATTRTSDACPACMPNWNPEQVGTTGQRQRVLTRAEIDALQ